jgi:hexosaminidase
MNPLRQLTFAAAICMAAVFANAAPEQPADAIAARLLPPVQSLQAVAGEVVLTKTAALSLDAASGQVGRYFATRLRRGTGWPVPVAENGFIRFEIAANGQGSPEAYTLKITPAGITLRANSPAGIARGAETLLQLMPPAVYGASQCDAITLPVVDIADAPQFAWRGFHLDVSRKFQTKGTILKLLEGIASAKLNVFHWHLTDDQGWRLPIEGYPKLTENGPAYTRADIQDVVTRAAELGITILPEVDMPGHSGASCRAYPEISILNDKGQPAGTMNPGAEASYTFIEAVMKDVAAQFPNSPYVHIGADEVGSGGWKKDAQCLALMAKENLKGSHELYLHFINRAVAIAKKYGKRTIAWDEALDAKNDPSLITMSWRGMAPGVAAAKLGRQVIFTPTPVLYIDHANTRSKNNHRAYSGHPAYLNHMYYSNAGIPAVPPEKRSLVMGAQVCLWGECVRSDEHMFQLGFPRAYALGENLWMPRERLDWAAFLRRLEPQRQRLDAMKIPYFWEPETLGITVGGWKAGEVAAKKGVIEIPLPKFSQVGEQEFYVGQGTGDGQFLISSAELLKDGVVVSTNKHDYESSMYKNTWQVYILKNPDIAGSYSIRFHVKQLFGDGSAIVQLNPALAPDQYSKQCAPGSGSNGGLKEPGPTLQ